MPSGSLRDIWVSLVDSVGNAFTGANPLPTASGPSLPGSNAAISAANSSTANLTANSVFNGTFEDVSNYSAIEVSIASDRNSATNGVKLFYSEDGVNTRYTDQWTHSTTLAGSPPSRSYAIPLRGFKFVRIQYTNGTVGQGSFELTTIYRINPREVAFRHGFYSNKFGLSGNGTWEELPTHNQVGLIPQGAYSNAAPPAAVSLQTNIGWVTAQIVINVTAVPGGTPAGFDLALNYADSTGAVTRVNTALSPFIQTTGVWRIAVGAGIAAGLGVNTTNVRQLIGIPLSPLWNVSVVFGDAGTYTFKVTADLNTG